MKKMSGSVSVLELPEPDGVLSAADVKEVAADIIGQLPLEGTEGLVIKTLM